MFDLNEAEAQRENTTIPAGIYRLRTKIKPGGMGEDGTLRLAKSLRTYHLELELTVVGDEFGGHEHDGHKVRDWVTVELDERDGDYMPPLEPPKLEDYRTAVRIGRTKLRSMFESGIGSIRMTKAK